MPDWMMRLGYSTLKEVVYRQIASVEATTSCPIKMGTSSTRRTTRQRQHRREQLLG
jgi:hypothetical protein